MQKTCVIRGCRNSIGKHPRYCDIHVRNKRYTRSAQPPLPGTGGGRQVPKISGECVWGPDRFNPIYGEPFQREE